MKVTIRETEYTLNVTKYDNSIIVDNITLIDGEEPFTTAPGYYQLIDMLETFCQDILLEEYKREAEQENGDLMIDRHLTERGE